MKPITISIENSNFANTTLFATDYFVISVNTLDDQRPCGKLHYHNSYEVELLLEGEIAVNINSKQRICSAGYCYIIFPNSFHQCTTLAKNSRILSLKFTEKALTKEVLESLKTDFPYYGKNITAEELSFIEAEIDSLILKLGRVNTDAFIKTVIKCTLSQIIGKLFDSSKNDASVNNTVFPKKLVESVDFVKKSFIQKLSRTEIAASFGFSPAYYSVLFKKYTGKGFSEFVLAERLKRAYYLILSTDSNIGTIAQETGFESFSYFSKAFKDAYGQSPSEVRETARL